MSFYINNPNVWSPPEESRVLAILIPESEMQISQSRYLVLLARRVDWLIERWMDEQQMNRAQTQRFLEKACNLLESVGDCPGANELSTMEAWRQEWGKALADNEIVKTKLSLQGVSFPVAVKTDKVQVQWLLGLFEEIDGEVQPNLEEWLDELIHTARED
jgi:hypothetical protein